MSEQAAEDDVAYREQAEAIIADLRARVSHYEARIAAQLEPEVSENDLRTFIFEVVRRNESLPIRLLRSYRITPRPSDTYRAADGLTTEGA